MPRPQTKRENDEDNSEKDRKRPDPDNNCQGTGAGKNSDKQPEEDRKNAAEYQHPFTGYFLSQPDSGDDFEYARNHRPCGN